MNDGRIWRIATISVIGLTSTGLLAGVIWLGVTAQIQRDQIAASQANAQALYEQLLSLGEKPNGEAPAEVVNGTPGATGATGARGTDGRDGADGINGRDDAPGTNGTNGKDGAPGEDGTPGLNGSPGEPGAPGTNGKDGQDGTPGADGRDGVGIQDVDCLDDGTWRFTMTDATTRDVPGPCKVMLTPTPAPEERQP